MHFHDMKTGWLCVGSLLVGEFKPKVLAFKDSDALKRKRSCVLCLLTRRNVDVRVEVVV